MTFAVLAAVSVPRLFAITVEVGDGESEAVKIAAENLRIDIARACPNHAKDSRRIVVRTKAGGPWESSTRTYANGVWTVTGADRRGTVYGIYAISDELGVSPFHWMDDIPVAQCEKFDLSTKTKKIDAPQSSIEASSSTTRAGACALGPFTTTRRTARSRLAPRATKRFSS